MSNNDNDRIQLRVMGISYSQIQSGAYALILAELEGPARIPVVIGAAEAQAIAISMEGIEPPRPLTHDLFAGLCNAYDIELKEVFIRSFEDGIFSSTLRFTGPLDTEVELDARTSDAVAIAVRTGSPIFTTPEILRETGFVMEEVADNGDNQENHTAKPADIHNLSLEELHAKLAELIDNEQYEEAAKVKAIIDSRQAQNE